MEMNETLRKMNLEMTLSQIVGDGGQKADQVIAAARQRYADNSEPFYLGPDLVQEYSENDCICDNLEKAIWDEYFGRMSREARSLSATRSDMTAASASVNGVPS